ncbi:hypothetical protein K438DRAFT_1938051 [Mycena galopus ATCC 62051]|nr:hypothetical protein K438DRAFT_1938051 [Mycena galopus ATCC 62051]
MGNGLVLREKSLRVRVVERRLQATTPLSSLLRRHLRNYDKGYIGTETKRQSLQSPHNPSFKLSLSCDTRSVTRSEVQRRLDCELRRQRDEGELSLAIQICAAERYVRMQWEGARNSQAEVESIDFSGMVVFFVDIASSSTTSHFTWKTNLTNKAMGFGVRHPFLGQEYYFAISQSTITGSNSIDREAVPGVGSTPHVTSVTFMLPNYIHRVARIARNRTLALPTVSVSARTISERLQIYFKPEVSHHWAGDPLSAQISEAQSELSPHWRDGFTVLDISILRSFTPFTSAVVLHAEVLDPPKHLSLPRQFILKLNDRRFGYRDYQRPKLLWSPLIEIPLRRGIQKLVGPDRSHPIPTMYHHQKPWERPGQDPDSPCPEWEDWELEIYIWILKHDAYLRETLAYRHLRSLQACIIPRLYGTVRLPISEGAPFLHPIVDLVHGLAIEHIASPTMADVAVGVDVTSQRAEEISTRILDRVAAIRDADILVPGSPEAASFGTVNEVKEMRKLLSNGDYGDWHIRSPLQQHVYERHAQLVGYATINSEIEQIPEDVRLLQFERIPGSGGPEEKGKRLQWRVRLGTRTEDDYVHEWLLTYPPDPVEDFLPT